MKRNLSIITLLLCLTLIFTSCGSPTETTYSNVGDLTIIDECLSYLTSDECNGRQVGTKGNLLAQKYLSNTFKKIGLSPYNENYYHTYEQDIITINDITLEVEGGQTFVYGKDFISTSANNMNLTLPVVDKAASCPCILLTDSYKSAREAIKNNNNNIKCVITVNNKLNKSIPSIETIPTLVITDKTYKILKENIGDKLHIKFDYTKSKEQVNNVLGIIKGSNNSHALLITAHFDHINNAGESIYRGAVDNCSGVATILDMANNLCSYYSQSKKPKIDIIFCAFNGEEGGLNGSEALTNELKSKYQSVTNINFDCIGEKSFKTLHVGYQGNEKTQKFCEEIAKYFTNHDIETEQGFEGQSDHLSFDQSIILTTGFGNGIIHTPKDTLDKLDYQYISNTSNLLSDYLKDYVKNLQVTKSTSTKDYDKLVSDAKKQLSFGEYMFIDWNPEPSYVSNNTFEGTLDEFNNLFSDMDFIPTKIDNIDISEINLGACRPVYYNCPDPKKHEIGKVYKRQSILKDISTLILEYNKKNEFNISIYLSEYIKACTLEEQMLKESLPKNKKKENIFKVGSKEYYVDYRDDKEMYDEVKYSYDNGTCTYCVLIFNKCLNDKDNEAFKNFIVDNKIGEVIDGYIDYFSKIEKQ